MRKTCYLLTIMFSNMVAASELNIPNQFTANTAAVAVDVNENFTAVKASVDDNDSRLDALEALVTQLQADLITANNTISNLQSNTVLSLDGYLQLATFDGNDTAEFTGINVQINSGSGTTSNSNGLGNLIVGYNEFETNAPNFCIPTLYDNETDCNDNGGSWGNNIHTGSHNIIVGRGHSYTRYGGVVTGYRNAIIGAYSNVSGGYENIASGSRSSVTGGENNVASGSSSSISGGDTNTASGSSSSISGGQDNIASLFFSSVTGGRDNVASGVYSSVTGGVNNVASGNSSSISGGNTNISDGIYSSVTGGRANVASGTYSSVTGGDSNVASGTYSSVSGGGSRSASSTHDWAAGSLSENN